MLFLLLFSVFALSAPGKGKIGFIALKGPAAANFNIPTNLHLVGLTKQLAGGLKAKRYQQIFENAKVLGGQLTVISDTKGNKVGVIGEHYPGLLSTNIIKLKGKAAMRIAISKAGAAGKWNSRLMINPSNGRYFYMVENKRSDSRWFYWIDAEDGSITNSYNGLTTGSGLDVQGDTKDLTDLTTGSAPQYKMISSDGRQRTYDAQSKSRLPGILAVDDDDAWDTPGDASPGQPAMVDAHFYANVTDKYFYNTHNFDWLYHYPQGIVSSAHVKRRYNNAFWNGSQMAYGDGDGSTFRNLSGDLDVVGHELTHGVTEATSNLIYQNESGALNEAFSDIMGTNIEFANNSGNWTIGEDITVGTNGIRNMENPNEDDDPSHYTDRYTGTSDNGGVHINSGIANHWYYLLVNGGQNANSTHASGTNVVGIGITVAEKIAFAAFTSLNSTADFCAARAATLVSSFPLYPTSEANVADAWDEVGVTEALCNGNSGGGTGGGDSGGGEAPVITAVESKSLRGVKFQISWLTDVNASTEVRFTNHGTYTKSDLVTNHAYNFNGSKGVSYEYYVASVDINGNRSEKGPFVHNN